MQPFTLAVIEGQLEEPVVIKILSTLSVPTAATRFVIKGSRTAFWRDAGRYNRAAIHCGPVLGLADLQGFPCPSGLIARSFPQGKHPAFVLRVAERMLESWLLADATSLAAFMRVSTKHVPANPDVEAYPKQILVNLARRSRIRGIREDMIPEPASTGVVGRGYTSKMTEYVERHWQPFEAARRSESLRRAIAAIKKAAEQ